MIMRRGALVAVAGGALALLSGCSLLGRSSYRFRMTVEVDTPEGLRSGSSVYEVTAGRPISFLPGMANREWTIRGEATAVDLPGGRTLFALLKTAAHFDDMMGLSMATLFPRFAIEGYDVVGVAAKLARGDYPGPTAVRPENYPLLVTFSNVADPATVEAIDPSNLGATFGPRFALSRIVVELTNAVVTRAVEKRLKWLKTHRSTLIPGAPRLLHEAKPIQLLGPSAFSTELYK